MDENRNVTKDEGVAAALAHGLIVSNWMGVIGSGIIWLMQKDKSEYVAFQALQATVYQFVALLAWLLVMACYVCAVFGAIGLAIPLEKQAGGDVAGPLIVFMSTVPLGALMLVWAVFIAYGLVGAYATLKGRDFRYILIGDQVKRYLERE